MEVDVLFNLGSAMCGVADEAILALSERVQEQWPFEQINEALAHYYDGNNPTEAPPYVYPVGASSALGYIVRSRDDGLGPYDLSRALQGMIEENGFGNGFSPPTPFSFPGEWDGMRVGVVVYGQPYGECFPDHPLGYALSMLYGQPGWDAGFLWLYPVGRPQTAGIWIGGKVDDLNDNPEVTVEMFRRVRDCNTKQMTKAHPEFARRRFFA